jgi:hypothetical protein
MMPEFTLDEMADCAEREVKIRQRVYPNRIQTGRMTIYQAQREIGLMHEIAVRLRAEAEANPGKSGRLF